MRNKFAVTLSSLALGGVVGFGLGRYSSHRDYDFRVTSPDGARADIDIPDRLIRMYGKEESRELFTAKFYETLAEMNAPEFREIFRILDAYIIEIKINMLKGLLDSENSEKPEDKGKEPTKI